jgi:uncharacterized protein (DUF433 family)
MQPYTRLARSPNPRRFGYTTQATYQIAALGQVCYTALMRALEKEEAVKDWRARIVIDPQVLVGKPTVRGTRLAVEFIIDLLAQGWTEAEILHNYPGLTHEDVQACLGYASATLRAEKVYPLVAA